jgi:uncharacterized SAM-binding protein YcdF (DUF218 family)
VTGAVRAIGGFVVVLFLVLAFTPAVSRLGRWMTPHKPPLGPAQAIVVLGGGGVRGDGELTTTSLRRTQHGIGLYRAGLAPVIVFSGTRSAYGAEALVRSAVAQECGVPRSAILTEATGRTTHEEAVRIARLLHSQNIRTIALVADAEGMWRAQRTFERAGFVVTAAPASDVSSLSGEPEDRLEVARRQAMELFARVYYAIAGYL